MKKQKTEMDIYFDKCCKNKFVIESEKYKKIAESKKATEQDKDRYEDSKKLAIKACFDIIDKLNFGEIEKELTKKCKCDGKCGDKCKCKGKNKEKNHGKKK